jgi:acyl dehydratase
MDAGAAGKTFPSYEFHVERGKIREFADAIGDPNPIYRDPDYAAEMGFAAFWRRRRCCARSSTSRRRHRRRSR